MPVRRTLNGNYASACAREYPHTRAADADTQILAKVWRE